ncbi:MAG: hypothetical protein AABY87_08195 [bacterium]
MKKEGGDAAVIFFPESKNIADLHGLCRQISLYAVRREPIGESQSSPEMAASPVSYP